MLILSQKYKIDLLFRGLMSVLNGHCYGTVETVFIHSLMQYLWLLLLTTMRLIGDRQTRGSSWDQLPAWRAAQHLSSTLAFPAVIWLDSPLYQDRLVQQHPYTYCVYWYHTRVLLATLIITSMFYVICICTCMYNKIKVIIALLNAWSCSWQHLARGSTSTGVKHTNWTLTHQAGLIVRWVNRYHMLSFWVNTCTYSIGGVSAYMYHAENNFTSSLLTSVVHWPLWGRRAS